MSVMRRLGCAAATAAMRWISGRCPTMAAAVAFFAAYSLAVQGLIQSAWLAEGITFETLLSVATLLFGASEVFSELSEDVNLLWKVPPRQGSGQRSAPARCDLRAADEGDVEDPGALAGGDARHGRLARGAADVAVLLGCGLPLRRGVRAGLERGGWGRAARGAGEAHRSRKRPAGYAMIAGSEGWQSGRMRRS